MRSNKMEVYELTDIKCVHVIGKNQRVGDPRRIVGLADEMNLVKVCT